jgi:hypothetical protein
VLFLGLEVAVWYGWGYGVFCAVLWLVLTFAEICGTGKSGFFILRLGLKTWAAVPLGCLPF